MNDKRLDYIKPMILSLAGIVASSVAILIALAAGTASKEADLYRPVFAHAMAPMAIAVVVASIGIVLLQIMRSIWLLAPRLFRRMPPLYLRLPSWVAVVAVFAASSWLTVLPGYEAAQYLVTGAVNVVQTKNPDLYLCAKDRRALPGILRCFYHGGPTGPCRG